MFEGKTRQVSQREMKPVARRATWVAWGLALQTIGVGIPVTVALRHANRNDVPGSVTHYTVRLMWNEMLRSHADVGLLVLGALLFVVGAMITARPFVTRRATLLVAVAAAAAASLALLGVLALVCAAGAVINGSGDAQQLFDSISWPGGRRKRRR